MEKKIITKYIKINENKTYKIKLNNDEFYEIDVNKHTSSHNAIKKEHTNFCGDTPLQIINENLPKSYKYF